MNSTIAPVPGTVVQCQSYVVKGFKRSLLTLSMLSDYGADRHAPGFLEYVPLAERSGPEDDVNSDMIKE